MSNAHVKNASATAERLMRAFYRHCQAPDLDTLFGILEASHSANDRVKKAVGTDFLDIPEFLALKCLRNFFHHHDELRHEIRVVPTIGLPIQTDLLFMCLAPRGLIDNALSQVPDRFRERTQQASEATFHWYGAVVNINPCLFNFVVHAYQRLQAAEVPLAGPEVDQFRKSYDFESANGYSHLIYGRISTAAGGVDALLSALMGSIEHVPDEMPPHHLG